MTTGTLNLLKPAALTMPAWRPARRVKRQGIRRAASEDALADGRQRDDQEMGGFRPGAGRALVKLGNAVAGARAGRWNADSGLAPVLIATVWQTWHALQALPWDASPSQSTQSGWALNSGAPACARPIAAPALAA